MPSDPASLPPTDPSPQPPRKSAPASPTPASPSASPLRPYVIPLLRSRDAYAAMDWLERAFGFVRRLVVPDGSGGVRHAQLAFGDGVVMLGSVRPGEPLVPPSDSGGLETQSLLLVAPDVDALHDRARAAGAVILSAPSDQPFGGRLFVCRDPEGRTWSVGSYVNTR